MFSFHFKISFCKSLDAFGELFHAKNLSELTRYVKDCQRKIIRDFLKCSLFHLV